MKKKIFISFILLMVVCMVTGCGEQKEEKSSKNDTKLNGKSVVVYFSATGNTKKIAEKVASLSNSELIEIIPLEEYTKEDLNYNSDCRANREQNDDQARPKIKNNIDIQDYDIVYLGYPIWWETNPRIIYTLLDSYDFSNKTIIPFCTSG